MIWESAYKNVPRHILFSMLRQVHVSFIAKKWTFGNERNMGAYITLVQSNRIN
jgi:hypothetical protein